MKRLTEKVIQKMQELGDFKYSDMNDIIDDYEQNYELVHNGAIYKG